MKKSMNSTEGEAASSSMTLTVHLDESKNVFSFFFGKTRLCISASVFQLSKCLLTKCAPVHEELQQFQEAFFFTSHICRQVIVIGLENVLSLFLNISTTLK